uniref:DNA-binding protein n=1 Tax=Adenoviridae sp. TaxID=2558248 RepID=A0A7D5U6G7_9ADEN|nr:MAG: DNA-binding protein [Adenoviridae sp.]
MLRASKDMSRKPKSVHVTPLKRVVSDDSDREVTPVRKKPKACKTLEFESDEEEQQQQQQLPTDEQKMQKAIDACWKLGGKLKVPMDGFTFSPTEKHLERIFAAYARLKKQTMLTYSNLKSFNAFGGRLLLAAVSNLVDLKPKFEPTGAFIWRHQWFEEPKDVRCFHGVPMFTKEVTYRVKADSERGYQALNKGEGELEMAKNEKTPPMVLITLNKYGVCYRDQYEKRSNSFHRESCGMSFSDVEKAYAAAKNAEAFNAAAFPNSKNVEGLVMVVYCCECNYAGQQVEGRQTCKITPWVISEAKNKSIGKNESESYASVCERYPYTFVFQCCKFQGTNNPNLASARPSKQDQSKPCDFRLSYTDAIKALVLVKSLIEEFVDEPCKIHFPRFVWQECWKVKSAVAPYCNITSPDPNPFD